jgi:hypothetical protein
VRSWKRRYFLLCAPDALLYFDDKDTAEAFSHAESVAQLVMGGSLPLGSAQVTGDALVLIAPEDELSWSLRGVNRLFRFRCDEKGQREAWREALQRCKGWAVEFARRYREEERRRAEEDARLERDRERRRQALLRAWVAPFAGGTVGVDGAVWFYAASPLCGALTSPDGDSWEWRPSVEGFEGMLLTGRGGRAELGFLRFAPESGRLVVGVAAGGASLLRRTLFACADARDEGRLGAGLEAAGDDDVDRDLFERKQKRATRPGRTRSELLAALELSGGVPQPVMLFASFLTRNPTAVAEMRAFCDAALKYEAALRAGAEDATPLAFGLRHVDE